MIGNEDETIYFALDSDAIINLTIVHHFFPGGKNRQPLDFEMINSISNQSVLKSLPELTYAYQNFMFTRDKNDKVVPVKKPRVKFIVPYTAFGEVCDYACKKENAMFKEDFREVLTKTMCRFDDSKWKNKDDLVREVRSLARAYTKDFVFKGKKYSAPMKLFKDKYDVGKIPSDCLIMAEATVHGVDLLTFNAKDYVYNDEVEDISGRMRKFGVCAINEIKGYKRRYVNAVGDEGVTLSRPYHFGQVMRKFMSEHEDNTFAFRVKPKTKRIEHNEMERI